MGMPGLLYKVRFYANFSYEDHARARFEFTEGDTSLFRTPNTAVISERGAARLFGGESPVGKYVEFASSDVQRYGAATRFTIVGVYRDFPQNSSVDKELLINLGNYDLNNGSTWAYGCYIRRAALRNPVDSISSE